MQFGLLGALEVFDDLGAPVELGGSQPRTVLAALLVAGGHVVPAEALVDSVWGEEPPASATGTLQSYISRLRRALEAEPGPARAARRLVSEASGYRLVAATEEVDFRAFEALADTGRERLGAGDAAGARDALVAADALWRGPALLEHRDREFATGLATRLEQRRLGAVEDRVAADLLLGRHGTLVAELGQLVADHPLREGLRAHLALALYRSGRQADALRTIQEARQLLVDELGVDPGRPLRELEVAILAQDPQIDLVLPPAAAQSQAAARSTSTTSARAVGDADADVAVAPAGAAAAAVAGGMVGRRAELAALVEALDESAASTRVVLVEGEPGIGKTRLVEELSAEAARRGGSVLWGRAFEGGAAPALWPWLPPLRALLARGIDDRPAPGLASLLDPYEVSGPSGGAEEPARFMLFESVCELLTIAAGSAPVLLVLDDLQWADVASLELLSAVAGRLREVPLLLVGTVRELEVGRNDAVVDALAVLTRHPGARRIRLRGLDRDEIAEVVRRTSGETAATGTIDVIQDRAEGNPFFATELARLLASGEGLRDVPSGVRDVVRRRLTHLPPATSELLQLAAVIGRDVEIGLLARASDRTLDACLDDLEPAVLQRLLAEVPEQPGVYRFVHALVREVVADDVSSLRRARLHLRIADALKESDETAEILAEHLWASVPVGEAWRAADALERAAGIVMRRQAWASAEHLLERAVQLRRAAGSAPDDEVSELLAVTQLVSVVGARYGLPALIDSPMLARGKELARRNDRPFELQNLLWGEWAALDISNRYDQADPIARELLERLADSDNEAESVLGHTAYGISCWHRGELLEAAEHLDRAAASLDGAPADLAANVVFDRDQFRLSMPFSVYIHDLIGDIDDVEARFDAVVQALPGDRYWELLVQNFAASSALSLGDVDRALRACARGIEVDPDELSAFWSMALRCYEGAALCLAGDLERGLPALEEAWRRYTGAGIRTNGATWLAVRAQALADAGRLPEAAAALAEAWDELRTYRDQFSESIIHVAEAVVVAGSGGDPAAHVRLAVDVALSQGGVALADRARREATRLGVSL